MPKRGQQQLNKVGWKCACGFQMVVKGDEKSCQNKRALVMRLHKKKCDASSKVPTTHGYSQEVVTRNGGMTANAGNLGRLFDE